MRLPFEGLTKLQIGKLLVLLGVHRYRYAKGEEIIPTIKNDNIIGIVLSGFAQIMNIEYNGNEMVQENLGKDSVFGTTISATNSEDCQIIAKEDTEVLIIDSVSYTHLDVYKRQTIYCIKIIFYSISSFFS